MDFFMVMFFFNDDGPWQTCQERGWPQQDGGKNFLESLDPFQDQHRWFVVVISHRWDFFGRYMDAMGMITWIYGAYIENIRRWRESGGFWDGVSIDWLNYGELTTMGTASISRYDTTLQYIL
jgi:hypothetical protein